MQVPYAILWKEAQIMNEDINLKNELQGMANALHDIADHLIDALDQSSLPALLQATLTLSTVSGAFSGACAQFLDHLYERVHVAEERAVNSMFNDILTYLKEQDDRD